MGLVGLALSSSAIGDDTADAFTEGDTATLHSAEHSAEAPTTAAPGGTVRVKKGRQRREKQAEGTKARNRFEADTVIKSDYIYDGQQLEVDPD